VSLCMVGVGVRVGVRVRAPLRGRLDLRHWVPQLVQRIGK